jgi:2-amino-4-hydroxy-6-hydroxymethyldihydropteridine diphosphokinase
VSRKEVQAWIGLGANIGDPVAQLLEARRRLASTPSVELLDSSSLYQSSPWGVEAQPDFLNAVLRVNSTLPALELLDTLLTIEQTMGRQRSAARWGPRRIDLDLLLYGAESYAREGRLQLPHPRLHLRRFVLEPIHELEPDLVVPGHGPVRNLLTKIVDTERGDGSRNACRRLANTAWDRGDGSGPAGAPRQAQGTAGISGGPATMR